MRLTQKQKASTFLSLLQVWDVGELTNKEDVQRHANAEAFAYFLPIYDRIKAIANILDHVRAQQGGSNTYWAVSFDHLADLIGSKTIARLALGIAGYWPSKCAETDRVEWSDAQFVGGPRNDLKLPSYLAEYRFQHREAA